MRQPSLAAKLGAEFMGTFWLVFGGCGSAVLAAEFLSDNQVQLGIGFLGVGLAFGLIVNRHGFCAVLIRAAPAA
jgi:aquaporin Z